MPKLKLSEIELEPPVVRCVSFQHPKTDEAYTIHLRKPTMAAVLALREAARRDIDEWVTPKKNADGTVKLPNLYQLDGRPVPMSAALLLSVHYIHALQCAEGGGSLRPEDRYSVRELIDFSVKVEAAFVRIANEAAELVNSVGDEAKNSPAGSAEPGSTPSAEEAETIPA